MCGSGLVWVKSVFLSVFGAVANHYHPAGRQDLVKGGEIVVFLSFDFDFNIPTALKGWVGHAPQGRGALHIII